jgi:hypothetical protein
MSSSGVPAPAASETSSSSGVSRSSLLIRAGGAEGAGGDDAFPRALRPWHCAELFEAA